MRVLVLHFERKVVQQRQRRCQEVEGVWPEAVPLLLELEEEEGAWQELQLEVIT